MGNNIFYRLTFPILLFIPLMILIYGIVGIPEGLTFGLTNFFVFLLSYIGMFLFYKRFFSLVKMVCIFFFFFLGVIPISDEINNNLYWGGDELSLSSKVITNITIIIGILSFLVGVLVSNMHKVSGRFESKFYVKIFSRNITNNRIYYLVLYSLLGLIILSINDFDIGKLLFRGLVDENLQINQEPMNQMESLLVNSFIRPMPFVLLAVYVYTYRSEFRKRSSFNSSENFYKRFTIFIFLLFSIFLVFPTAISRFQVAALYIPLIVIFTDLWNRPYAIQTTILGSLLIIFPFLEKFRHFDPEKFKWSIDMDFLNHGHFDAYQNFVRVIEVDFITYGNQLLGALLFYMPRSIWIDKPIGSGAALADVVGLSFSNISMPFIAEGYVNFGILGVVVFMFFLGILLNRLDAIAWHFRALKKESLFVYYYYFLFGMIFFMMRGDLMSSFAFTIGLTVSFLIIIYLLYFLNIRLRLKL